ncbi:MAG: excinuclease ABC subunit UvrA [Candidatus Sumerlaeia bacterium]|nr:excinuclease ABC subunit UvrA [Candidatus Sumerlaeia bacterium]
MPPIRSRDVVVLGAAEHNLKRVDATIPRNALTVVTGVSGSGKSSLAFDTIYAEGQRRYVESLSSYARQFLDNMPRPKVDHISGLSPAISIEQKTTGRNPRSTVGTTTEIYDYLRLLFAHLGSAACPVCGEPLAQQTLDDIVAQAEALPTGTRFMVAAPVVRGRKGEFRELFERAIKEGFERAVVDGEAVLLEPEMKLARHHNHDIALVVDRMVAGRTERSRLRESIARALAKAEGFATIETLPGADGSFPKGIPWKGARVFSESYGCPKHGPQIVELTPRMFSFNSRHGACPACEGIGSRLVPAEERIVGDPSKTIRQGAIAPWAMLFSLKRPKREGGGLVAQAERVAESLEHLGASIDTPWEKLKPKVRAQVLEGDGRDWEGLIPKLKRQLEESADAEETPFIAQFLREAPCPACAGARLRPEALAVTIDGQSIADVCGIQLGNLHKFLDALAPTPRQEQIARQPLKEIRDRLSFLLGVGLHYLSLDRTMGTLSGGEAQRIRLATQIGSRLTGVMYILDEPSIGLHQRDNERLIRSLEELRDLGNTVIVVEHDEQTIRSADHVLDLGPGAGTLGGHLVASGTAADIAKAPGSLTGQYLSGARAIRPDRPRRKPGKPRLRLEGCSHNNLKAIDAEFPLGLLIGVCGVSGSGKSSLVVDTLLPLLQAHSHGGGDRPGAHRRITGLEHIDKVVHVDQAPIGRTPRSNPCTYTKVFDTIRELFASTEEARIRGYTAGRFSFNVDGGRCPDCAGEGSIKVAMNFLPDARVECERCHGSRYNPETLEVHYRGGSIADVLAMTIEQALLHFDGAPQVVRTIRTLHDVGLGYLTLGQAATTLSGGEAQRIKLSRELSKRNTGRTVYILDEPTTGLHFEDVRLLVEVLQRLVDAGGTVIVIEHNLDLLRCCDWLLDLGPEGGAGGGELLAAGTPEAIAKEPRSETGRFLR